MRGREQTLATASTLPILKQPASRTERFPNVYDALAEAKQASAFVAGVKMALPASMARVNMPKYEEINIPVSGAQVLFTTGSVRPYLRYPFVGSLGFCDPPTTPSLPAR